MFALFRFDSFFSVWYWVLTVAVWTLVCHRTLGVPYDMILRARRLPEVAGRVDALAHAAAARLGGVRDRAGAPLAALAGFVLAAVAALGFATGLEAAQAAFALLFPLTLVWLSTMRLAMTVRRHGLRGPDLRRFLARRRLWNQIIAIVAILCAAVLALAHAPAAIGR